MVETGSPVRIGILGAAKIAPAALIKPARHGTRAVVAAVAARDASRAETFARKHSIPRVHSSYEALVADPEIDAVYVPLPNGLHGRWTIAALEAGKHVLCEKPFAANADEAREVAEVTRRHRDLVVMEAFHWRYHPQTLQVLEILERGDLGDVTLIEAAFCFPLLKRDDIRWNPALAPGALMDAGCYPVSMIRHLGRAVMGAGGADGTGIEPEVVSAHARLRAPGIDRSVSAELQFPDGGPAALLTCSMSASLRISLRVVGSRGELRVRNPLAPQFFGRTVLSIDGRPRVKQGAGRTSTYSHQLEAFCAAVLDGTSISTGVDDAVANMVVIDDVYRAAGLAPRTPTG